MCKSVFRTAVVCAGIGLGLGQTVASGQAPGLATSALPTAGENVVNNPFEGSWAGTFVNVDTGEGGTLEWTIHSSGRLVGSYLWDDGSAGSFVGVARPNGRMHVAAPGGGGAYRGQATLDANGNMLVDAEDIDSGAVFFVELALQ